MFVVLFFLLSSFDLVFAKKDYVLFSVCANNIITQSDLESVFGFACFMSKNKLGSCGKQNKDIQTLALQLLVSYRQKKCFFEELGVSVDEIQVRLEDLLLGYGISSKEVKKYGINVKPVEKILKSELVFGQYVAEYAKKTYNEKAINSNGELDKEFLQDVAMILEEKIKSRYYVEQKFN